MSKRMRIRDAFNEGLLEVGAVVITNGGGNEGACETTYFRGRITDVSYGSKRFLVMREDGVRGGGRDDAWIVIKDCGGLITFEDAVTKETTTKKSKLEVERMFKDGVEDVKGFVKENRYVLYWVSLILLADHFIFGGSMRDKIQVMFNSIIDTVNAKINGGSVKDTKD